MLRKFQILTLCAFISASSFAQNEEVKYEIAHVDLLMLSMTYGALEMAWRLGIENSMDNIIKHQSVIDSMFYKLVVLEEKTQEYQRELNERFLSSLNENYINNIINEIESNQTWMEEYVIYYPEYNDLVARANKNINERAKKIKEYIDNAAKKKGNTGRLDNKERNDLNLYVLDELHFLKIYSQKLCIMLHSVHVIDKRITLPKFD